VKDTWATRDLPVLDAIVTALEDSFSVSAAQVAADTGIPDEDVVRAFYALQGEFTGQVTVRVSGRPDGIYLREVTADARRAVADRGEPHRATRRGNNSGRRPRERP
jgi:hypothetical protein